MKIKFKSNILIDKKEIKPYKINTLDLKKRIQFVLSLMCDFNSEVSIRFCGQEEMLQTNSSFRKKKYATDVLSFPHFPNHNGTEVVYLGDILICVPVCVEQAKKAKHSLCVELEKMMIHGLVHLKGLDHERNSAAYRVMTNLEVTLQNELTKSYKKPKWCINGEVNVR